MTEEKSSTVFLRSASLAALRETSCAVGFRAKTQWSRRRVIQTENEMDEIII